MTGWAGTVFPLGSFKTKEMVEGWTEALKVAVTAVVTAAVAPADGDHEVTVGAGAGAGLAVWSS